MKLSSTTDVLHLVQGGGILVQHSRKDDGRIEIQSNYHSPKAPGTMEKSFQTMLEKSAKDKLLINCAALAPSLYKIDTIDREDTQALHAFLKDATGMSQINPWMQVAEFPKPRKEFILASLHPAQADEAKAIAEALGYNNHRIIHGSLSQLAALDYWQSQNCVAKPTAILELGLDASLLTLTDSGGFISQESIDISFHQIAATIQSKLQLKFESAAMLLFFNGVYDFARIADEIIAPMVETLKPRFNELTTQPDLLWVSTIPVGQSWLGNSLNQALELNSPNIEELPIFKDVELPSKMAKDPGMLAPLLLSGVQLDELPYFAKNQLAGEKATKSARSKRKRKKKPASPSVACSKQETPQATLETPQVNREAVHQQKAQTKKASAASPKPKDSTQPKPENNRPAPLPAEENNSKKKSMVIAGSIAATIILGLSLLLLGGNKTSDTDLPQVTNKDAQVQDGSVPNLTSSDPATTEDLQSEPAEINEEKQETDLPLASPASIASGDTSQQAATVLTITEVADEQNAIISEFPEATKMVEEPNIVLASFSLDSIPSGAKVLMSGSSIGFTPLHVENLEPGEYSLILKHPGFISRTLDFELNEEESLQLPTTKLDPDEGSLLITTYPENVAFTLTPIKEAEGFEPITGTTPASLNHLKTGKYTLKLTYADYQHFQKTLEIKSQQESSVEHLYPEGSLEISSTPNGATVFSGNKELGLTPLHIEHLPEGPMNLRFHLDNYEEAYSSVEVIPQDIAFVHQQLLSYDRVFAVNELDTPPATISNRVRHIQRATRDSQKFVVELVIDTTGIPEHFTILTSTNLALHDILLKDLREWRFQPAIRDGRNVRTRVRVNVLVGNPDQLPESIMVAQSIQSASEE